MKNKKSISFSFMAEAGFQSRGWLKMKMRDIAFRSGLDVHVEEDKGLLSSNFRFYGETDDIDSLEKFKEEVALLKKEN